MTFRILACVVLLFAAVPRAVAQDPAIDRLKSYHFGDDHAILDAVTQRVNEARANASIRGQVARDLAGILSTDASFDAKQFACRQLALIGSETEVPTLATLLKDEQLAHYALMALARMADNTTRFGGEKRPFPSVLAFEALLKALPQVKGRTRIEIADTLGEMHDEAAVPALEALLRGSDEAESTAAAFALAKIPAIDALIDAYGKASGPRKPALGEALLILASRLSSNNLSWNVYDLLKSDDQPILRAAALRGQARIYPEKALPLVLTALGEDGTPRQKAAADLVRSLPGPGTTGKLAEALPTLSPRGKIYLTTALADRADRAATPAVAALTKDSDSAVRMAAIHALATLGDASSVTSLLQAASRTDKEERDAARSSLSVLKDPAVNQRLLAAAGSGEPSIRAEAIQMLGQRQVASALPVAIQAAKGPASPVTSAATHVLRDLATPAQLPALLDLLLSAPADERSDLADMVSEVARRGATEPERTGAILQRLAKASRPADKAELFRILRQIGGPAALTALRTSIGDSSADIRAAAIRQIAEWPTDEPMPDLLRSLKSSQDRRQRTLALRGYIRMIGLNEQRSPADALKLYREAAGLATSADEKRMILGGLGKVRSLGALELASGYLKDEDLKAEAELAVVDVARATAGAYPDKTRAVLEPIARSSANEEPRNRAKAILDLMGKFGDFVTVWEVSPAYQRAGLGYSQLFDTPFPPEDPAAQKQVAWTLMPAGGAPDQPWLLDLLAALGGEQRVAYLRTSVLTDAARDLTLEMGSDDGIKVWLNGQVVYANNVARAAAPGQDKFKVPLRPGRNDLLVKVTQNVMGWGACARFTDADGSPVSGLKYTIPSDK